MWRINGQSSHNFPRSFPGPASIVLEKYRDHLLSSEVRAVSCYVTLRLCQVTDSFTFRPACLHSSNSFCVKLGNLIRVGGSDIFLDIDCGVRSNMLRWPKLSPLISVVFPDVMIRKMFVISKQIKWRNVLIYPTRWWWESDVLRGDYRLVIML